MVISNIRKDLSLVFGKLKGHIFVFIARNQVFGEALSHQLSGCKFFFVNLSRLVLMLGNFHPGFDEVFEDLASVARSARIQAVD